ncbi:MAG TPA: GntR family transcriptional regulator [Streptosporangiaceae bacterium]|jgi:GntR family transcriptional regulator|nr:GntR family transcriptional regulator [Streptosporangiaceae bacterium]
MTDGLGIYAPKYQRIADALRREIKAGTYAPGDRLPAETTLLDRFRSEFGSLSLPTLRQAIAVLRAEGLIESLQGIGTFVKDNRRLQRRSRHRYGRARADRQLLTPHLSHEILYAGPGTVPDHIADAAPTLPAGASVVIRRRLLRDRDTGRPEELGASYIPASIAAGTYLENADVVPQALFLCVEELSGKRYTRAHDRWLVRPATAEEPALLDIPGAANVVHLIHSAYDETGDILEVSESIWPADRIVILDDYDLAQDPEDLEGLSDV